MATSTPVQQAYGHTNRYIRAIILVLALIIGSAGVGFFAPTAFGQIRPAVAQIQASPYSTPQLTAGAAAQTVGAGCSGSAQGVSAEPFVRTELFFGTQKPNGKEVSDEEFNRFVDQVVTQRFPDGLTLLSGYGQFLNSKGVIVQENSKLLILLYPVKDQKDKSNKIEKIRELYKTRFEQESVLRSDDPRPVCVSF